jgi:hypothetical protein
LSNAQFYAFLNQSIKHKAIDRLRKRRLPTSTLAELEGPGNSAEENDPLNTVSNSIWGSTPFPTPEAAALEAASQQELRILLKHCIEALSAAPRQLQAVLQELEEVGSVDLLQELREEYRELLANLQLTHLSQHKDHLAVIVAFRLTEYGEYSADAKEALVDIKALAKDDLSEREVQTGLKHLVAASLLEWHGEEIIRFSSVQRKYLARFYEEGE